MADDRLARVQLVKLEVDRLAGEGGRCRDPKRLAAIAAEMDVLLESMRAIRREQLLEQIAPAPRPRPRRRWWQRTGTAAS